MKFNKRFVCILNVTLKVTQHAIEWEKNCVRVRMRVPGLCTGTHTPKLTNNN